ncbi:MAG: hypothetical protein QM692_08440 [Thermomicrobiales bacterium]
MPSRRRLLLHSAAALATAITPASVAAAVAPADVVGFRFGAMRTFEAHGPGEHLGEDTVRMLMWAFVFETTVQAETAMPVLSDALGERINGMRFRHARELPVFSDLFKPFSQDAPWNVTNPYLTKSYAVREDYETVWWSASAWLVGAARCDWRFNHVVYLSYAIWVDPFVNSLSFSWYGIGQVAWHALANAAEMSVGRIVVEAPIGRSALTGLGENGPFGCFPDVALLNDVPSLPGDFVTIPQDERFYPKAAALLAALNGEYPDPLNQPPDTLF